MECLDFHGSLSIGNSSPYALDDEKRWSWWFSARGPARMYVCMHAQVVRACVRLIPNRKFLVFVPPN